MQVEFEKQTGIVVWFSSKKGFGFITPDDKFDDKDVFAHWSGISMDGYKQLKAGDIVEYALKDTDKGVIAVDIIITEEAKEEVVDEAKEDAKNL